MNTGDFKASMDRYILDKLKMLNTIKPAVVTAIAGASVQVKPLTTTKYRDGTHLACPELFDVPLLQLSTKSARIELPVEVGDIVIVLFSDRDIVDLLDRDIRGPDIVFAENSQPLGMYPLVAIPIFLTGASSRPVARNLQITCQGTTITVSDSGVHINGVVTADDIITKDVPEGLNAFATTHTHLYSPGPGTPTETAPPTPAG
jgi:hypothetical protein